MNDTTKSDIAYMDVEQGNEPSRPNDPSYMEHFRYWLEQAESIRPSFEESMDGDHATALASAGFGTDEDYEHNLID